MGRGERKKGEGRRGGEERGWSLSQKLKSTKLCPKCGWLGHSMPAGNITAGSKSVTRAMGAASSRRGTIASANQPPLPWLWKRRWYVLRLLSGAIPSTWPYLFLPFIITAPNTVNVQSNEQMSFQHRFKTRERAGVPNWHCANLVIIASDRLP